MRTRYSLFLKFIYLYYSASSLIESNENSDCKYVFPPAFRAHGIPQHFEAKVCDLREPVLWQESLLVKLFLAQNNKTYAAPHSSLSPKYHRLLWNEKESWG